MKNLVLIGFMGTGKTSVGRACARALGYRFRDSDALVERRARRSVPEIFAAQGEAAFRRLESAAIRTLARGENAVISTGGGAVLDPGNAIALRQSGVVVLLQAGVEVIHSRTEVRGIQARPLLVSEVDSLTRIRTLLAEREPLYLAAAHAVVDTDGLSRDEVVDRVIEWYRALAPAGDPLASVPWSGR